MVKILCDSLGKKTKILQCKNINTFIFNVLVIRWTQHESIDHVEGIPTELNIY